MASAQSVEVQHWFPDNPTSEFYPSKPMIMVIGVRNSGSAPFNVTAAAGTLQNPFNASQTVYNFTVHVRRGQGAAAPRQIARRAGGQPAGAAGGSRAEGRWVRLGGRWPAGYAGQLLVAAA